MTQTNMYFCLKTKAEIAAINIARMKMTMRKDYELLNKATRQEATQHNVKNVTDVEITAV